MKPCPAVTHGRCLYLECKGPKHCLRRAGGQVPNWTPQRQPGAAPKKGGKK